MKPKPKGKYHERSFSEMKKNKMLRIASILLVVTLLSTCVISGTFAKYVTKAEGEDQARVAKWGIVVSVEGDTAFSKQYKTDDEAAKAAIEYSVVSQKDDNVVAPGTTQGSLKGSVKGTPEVATRYALTIKDWTDIVLPKGTYTDYTEYVLGEGYSKEFTLENDYAPIKWDIVCKDTESGNEIMSLLGAAAKKIGTTKEELNAAGVYGFSATEAKVIISTYKDALIDLLKSEIPSIKNADIVIDGDNLTISADFEPGKEVHYTFELQWKWAFEGPTANVTSTNLNAAILDPETVDKADTFLGNWAAKEFFQEDIPNWTAPNGGSLEVKATVIASATQID